MLGSSLQSDDPFYLLNFILFLPFLFFSFNLNERERLEHYKRDVHFLVQKQSCFSP